MNTSQIEKWFPADTRIKNEVGDYTFLADKSIDALLYAYLLTKSYAREGMTVVNIKKLDAISDIVKIIRVSSRQTYYNHLNTLKTKGYIEEKIYENEPHYILKKQENFFFKIPLDSLKFLLDVSREDVVKTLIYLGHQYECQLSKGKPYYDFTLTELGQHIGKKVNNHSGDWERLRNYLIDLRDLGFIEIQAIVKNDLPWIRLTKVNKEKKNLHI